MRGFDYRSAAGTDGIALLIAKTFNSKRAFLQGLGRCGRYSDQYRRAILTGTEPYLQEKLAKRLIEKTN